MISQCRACVIESGRLKAPFCPKHTCGKSTKSRYAKKYRAGMITCKCPKCNANIVENDGDHICENKECRYCIEPPPSIPVELYDVLKDINSNADILPFP